MDRKLTGKEVVVSARVVKGLNVAVNKRGKKTHVDPDSENEKFYFESVRLKKSKQKNLMR